MTDKSLYLIDATAFCYRAFYALKGLSTASGQPTNAVYGFVNILNKILKDKKPQHLAACFDVSRDTFRLKKYAEYKSQRPSMPDGLSAQMPLIREITGYLGLAIVQKQGFEADDIIATLAGKAAREGYKVVIVSSDKDILQLVDNDITVFNPYKDEGTYYSPEKVKQLFGVEPKRIVDLISLMGDAADNIPGVPGIGEKTAAELIRNFGSLKELIARIDQVKQEKTRNALIANIDQVKLNHELALLDGQVDLGLELEDLKVKPCDSQALFKIYKNLEFKNFLKNLDVVDQEYALEETAQINKKELGGLADDLSEVFLSCDESGKICMGFDDKFFQADSIDKKSASILSDPQIRKIGHDLKKTKVLLNSRGIGLEGVYFDTMVAAYLVNPSKAGYTLSELAWDYLEINIKPESLDNHISCDLLKKLKPGLEKELKNRSLTPLFEKIEMPLVGVLADIEITGIKLDPDKLKKLSRKVEKRLIDLIEQIYEISGTQFNINSPKQLGDVLFNRLKLPVVKKTKTGFSTDEEVLKALSSRHELPKSLLEYRQLMKLKNTYIDALPELVDPRDDRLHTSFNQTGTETGRLSSSKPNLQNIPIRTELGREIREAVIAFSADSRILSCDYSQIELRMMAHMSGDKEFISAFNQDKDIHKATAALIYNCGEKDVTDLMRDTAKRINFGIIYGLSAYGLSRDLGITHEQAQGFIDAYFSKYSGVKDYIDRQIVQAQKDGFVSTILGRRRYLPEIDNKNQAIRQLAQRQAVNTPLQGSASDLIKKAMIDIQAEIKSRHFKSRMILQIHDELLFDVPDPEMPEFSALAKQRMENVLKLNVPVKVDMKAGKNWSEMAEIANKKA